ncbi:MAG: hypothetical protein ACM3TU_01515 [Bacillota bacterium]
MVRFLIILAILVLALSFFGISIRTIVESPTGRDNFAFIWQIVKTGWGILVGWFYILVGLIQAAIPG